MVPFSCNKSSQLELRLPYQPPTPNPYMNHYIIYFKYTIYETVDLLMRLARWRHSSERRKSVRVQVPNIGRDWMFDLGGIRL